MCLSSAPCWPEVRADENPDLFALGGLQLRKGEGIDSAPCAIKVDLVSEEVFAAAA